MISWLETPSQSSAPRAVSKKTQRRSSSPRMRESRDLGAPTGFPPSRERPKRYISADSALGFLMLSLDSFACDHHERPHAIFPADLLALSQAAGIVTDRHFGDAGLEPRQ